MLAGLGFLAYRFLKSCKIVGLDGPRISAVGFRSRVWGVRFGFCSTVCSKMPLVGCRFQDIRMRLLCTRQPNCQNRSFGFSMLLEDLGLLTSGMHRHVILVEVH